MENRGRKRAELSEQLPADKRACSLSDHRPSSSSHIPSASETLDCEIDSSSSSSASFSGRSDKSCDDSDGPDHDHDHDHDHDYYHSRNSVDMKSKFKRILSDLSAEAGASSQLAALAELCELLLMCSDISLSSFSWESFAPLLVTLSQTDDNPDIMLFAVRALTYLCDVMPRSASILVRYDAVPTLCAPLMGIEYLDVAEQCLQGLEKISRAQPGPCLQAGAIMAVLNYIDFFSTSTQKVALSTVANICKKLPPDSSSFILEAIPILCNLLQYEDEKLVENVALSLIRIVDSLNHSSEILDELCKHGLIQQSTHLIASSGRMTLSLPIYTGLIRMLARLASGSFIAVKTLFELNISTALRNTALTADLAHAAIYSDSEETESSQIREALKLLNELLPPIEDGIETSDLALNKKNILMDRPELLRLFGMDVFPALIQVVSSGASSYVCGGCLCVINKLVYSIQPEMLLNLLNTTSISSFLASLFARKDCHVLISALKTVELIMQKLPGVLLNSFLKEGVVYAIDALQLPEKCSYWTAQKSRKNKYPSGSNHNMGGSMRDVYRCVCNAFDVGRSSLSLETGTCKLDTVSVQASAKHIKETYFTGISCNSVLGVSEILQKLRTLSALLVNDADTNSLTANDICSQHDILINIMMEIKNGDDPVSNFEFIESGIVKSLAEYLLNGKERKGELDQHILLKRFEVFSRVCLLSSGTQGEQMPITSLVQKLQSALCSLDHFPVILSHAPKSRNFYASIPRGHYTKYPCLKVRFTRGEGETQLGNYSQDTIFVEPFSSLDDIEGFLWPKVSSLNAEARNIRKKDGKYIEGEEVECSTSSCKEMLDMMQTVPSESCTSDSSSKTNLIFFLGGKQLDHSLTLYQSILQQLMNEGHDASVGTGFWNEVYTVIYRKSSDLNNSKEHISASSDLGSNWPKLPFFSSLLVAKLSCEFDELDPAYYVLVLLKNLEVLNRFTFHLMSHERVVAFAEGRINNFNELKVSVPVLPQIEFLSSKLTEKLEQQMRDPLAVSIGGMPLWCSKLVVACPFLFSFEARRKYFRLAAFGSLQAQPTPSQQRISNSSSIAPDERRSYTTRMPRERFQVCRDNILASASQMMDLYASTNVILEVEYKDEVGTGLGPTLEFYTLISHEFQNVGLGMWRDDHSSSVEGISGFVAAPFGLFPRPWSATSTTCKGVAFSEVIRKFVLLGQVVAKAIQDGRVLDLPFSKAFYKVLLGLELDIFDIESIDPRLGKTLVEFQALADRKRFLDSIPKGSSTFAFDLRFRHTRIEDLCLDFTLPGYSDYKLASGHDYNLVNINNLDNYVSWIVDATVRSGIVRQVEAFKSGFNQVFPLTTLQVFREEEFERLLCGERETWVSGELLDQIKFDHGYTASSFPIVALLEIIEEFGCEERRAFLQFVTGAPRLPPGGLAALNPKLTIVRKHCHDVDRDLPSVMTCANYLKLPPYSSKERMRERLLYAITEGQGSFHLS